MDTKEAPAIPKRVAPEELAAVGVRVIDAQNVWLRCLACGEAFVPVHELDGRLPNGYWKCPNGCNAAKAGGRQH